MQLQYPLAYALTLTTFLAGLRSLPYNIFQEKLDLKPRNAERNTSAVKSHQKTVQSLDLTHADLPIFATYQAMLEDDMNSSNDRSYPKHSTCPYQGLRKPLETKVSTETEIPKCRRKPFTLRDCKDVVTYFGEYGTLKPGKCNTNNAIQICAIAETKTDKREDIQISCDVSPCKGKEVSLGLFSDITGKIEWRVVEDINRTSKLIKSHILSSAFGPGFTMLKCGQGIQILNFPRILKRFETLKSQGERKRFNINIVVEDSLSRGHFYRALLKTVSTFRDIIYDQSIPSTLLEFDKVQSYASNTYHNLQRLFTARKYLNHPSNCEKWVKERPGRDAKFACTYGIDEMLRRYKTAGYDTLLQEDHCWHDERSSFLDPRQSLGRVENETTRLRRWKEYVELVKKLKRWEVIGDYGISTLTCDVYKKYNVTNPFNSEEIPNVCFAGRPYGFFILDYLKKYTELNDMAAQPFMAYTHLLTSHDNNGKRIVDDDESLSTLFHHVAHLRNTLTIFASDHGTRATTFSAYTSQGRQEIYQPFLFMIIPHEVTKLLGPDVMNALVVNQNRLVGIEDLHHSLVSIVDSNSKISRSNADNYDFHKDPYVGIIPTRLRGLFQPVPLDRTCQQMKLKSDVLCLCEGMDTTVSHRSHKLQWAAEFALGTLNNRIQEQYTRALKSKSGFYGYGACQRYTGEGITHARNIVSGSQEKFLFSLLAKPFGRKTVEIFDVEVSFPLKEHTRGITLNTLNRVTRYNEYEKCTDKNVDPKLCSCDYHNNTQWRNELFLKIRSEKNFKIKTKTHILDKPCLVIISRARKRHIGEGRWQKAFQTYEAVNACVNVIYELSIRFKKEKFTRISLPYPRSVKLLPRTVTFLLTAYNGWVDGIFVPEFKFKKRKLAH